MISYRKADIIDKIKETDAPIGIVRIVCQFFGNQHQRCVTAYLVESLTSDMVKKEALIKFTDDLWSSLPAVITNSYVQSPMGFSTSFKYNHILTMVSEDDGSGMMPSPDFITTAIETKFKSWGIKNEMDGDGTVSAVNGWLDSQYSIRWADIPNSFKPIRADLFDNMNRKKEWKQHRVDRAVGYFFGKWQRYWGAHAEYHSPKELLNSLIGNLNVGFKKEIQEDKPLMLSELQEFMSDPSTKKMFLEKFESFARQIGWTGPLGIREADLLDNMNRKKEWKQHRVDRAVNFLFDIWERFWGRGNEHSAGELFSTLTGNLANKAIQQSFIKVVRQESEVTFEEAQGFLKDPEMKPLFLKKFLEVARSKGEYDNDSIRNADLIDKFKQSAPIEFSVNFRMYLDNKQLAFKSIQHPQGESFTHQMQEKRDYIEQILVGILNGKGFYQEDNNWIKDYSIAGMFPAAISNLYGIMEALKDRDIKHRIVSISDQLIDDNNDRYSFKVVVK